MALINCSECQTQISDKAASCPECGAPVTEKAQMKKPLIYPHDLTAG